MALFTYYILGVNTVASGRTQVVSASSALNLTVKLVELSCCLMFGACKPDGRQKKKNDDEWWLNTEARKIKGGRQSKNDAEVKRQFRTSVDFYCSFSDLSLVTQQGTGRSNAVDTICAKSRCGVWNVSSTSCTFPETRHSFHSNKDYCKLTNLKVNVILTTVQNDAKVSKKIS